MLGFYFSRRGATPEDLLRASRSRSWRVRRRVILNPDSSFQALINILKKESEAAKAANLRVLEAAAKRSYPHEQQLSVLSEITSALEHSSYVATSRIETRDLSSSRKEQAHGIVEDLLENPGLDPVLVAAALSSSLDLISETASSPFITPLLAEALISRWANVNPMMLHLIDDARLRLAANPAAPPSVLTRLAKLKFKGSEHVLKTLASNPSTPLAAFADFPLKNLPRSSLLTLLAGLPPDFATAALSYQGELNLGAWLSGRGMHGLSEGFAASPDEADLDELSRASLRLSRLQLSAKRVLEVTPNPPEYLLDALTRAISAAKNALNTAKVVGEVSQSSPEARDSFQEALKLTGASLETLEGLVAAAASNAVSSVELFDLDSAERAITFTKVNSELKLREQ